MLHTYSMFMNTLKYIVLDNTSMMIIPDTIAADMMDYMVYLLPLSGALIAWGIVSRKRKSRERFRRLTLERFMKMDPREFERVVADMLRAMGYKDVRVVGGSGDRAVDILARYGKDTVAVQCKRYTGKKVTSPEIQMFIGMMLTEYRVRKGIYITTSSFTQDAMELAERHGIELWDGHKLADIASRLASR